MKNFLTIIENKTKAVVTSLENKMKLLMSSASAKSHLVIREIEAFNQNQQAIL